MLLTHHIDVGTLRVTLHQGLDVTNRAAAALFIQALVDAHRPAAVVLDLPGGPASAATMSAVARAKRMCDSLSIPFTLFHRPTERALSREPLAAAAGE
ncbi:hypothetical protein [Streptomyces sp. NPDC047981]|uniref:hypothetical protein n=1 Tax=Streptomyces sp. NPDC047981 TaxID=3154610 RepID=UPI00342A19DA